MYDGSISGYIWRGGAITDPLSAYGYKYDAAHRLLSADFRALDGTGWDNSVIDYTMDNATYDENGNILSMHQRGTVTTPPLGAATGGTGPVDIDQLSYSYIPGTNQLQNVTDAAADYNVGDFTDGNVSATTGVNDYGYDNDGNLAQDLNKGISSTTYNEMDKPLTVTFSNGGTISYVYDAAGTLITRTVNDGMGGAPLTYRYWGGFVYQSDGSTPAGTLQYILHQEGRARYLADSAMFKYDYFVKDHLGNVRSVVTADYAGTRTYFAGHEIAAYGVERSLFTNIDNVRDVKLGSADVTDDKAARLNGSIPSRRIGTAILMHVMAGDQFNVSAQSYWEDNGQGANTVPASGMLSSLLSTLVGGAGSSTISDGAATQIIQSGFNMNNYSAYQQILQNIANPDIPQAFINYLVFDEKMKLIPAECGAIQIGATAGQWQVMQTLAPITAARNGYVAIYMSNASLEDVYMDEMSIAVYKGRLLQEQDYYPFGLTINQGDATTAGDDVPQYFKFEGNEIYNDLGLNLQNFNARQYDYQIGRFTSIDPLADQGRQESLSPYHFCANDPANSTDPTGMITTQQSIAQIESDIAELCDFYGEDPPRFEDCGGGGGGSGGGGGYSGGLDGGAGGGDQASGPDIGTMDGSSSTIGTTTPDVTSDATDECTVQAPQQNDVPEDKCTDDDCTDDDAENNTVGCTVYPNNPIYYNTINPNFQVSDGGGLSAGTGAVNGMVGFSQDEAGNNYATVILNALSYGGSSPDAVWYGTASLIVNGVTTTTQYVQGPAPGEQYMRENSAFNYIGTATLSLPCSGNVQIQVMATYTIDDGSGVIVGPKYDDTININP